MQWILGLALAAAVFVILKRWGALTPEKKKDAVWKSVLVVGGALLLFMVLTGRVHVITAAIAAVIPDYMWRFRPAGQYSAIKDSAKNLRKA